MHLRVMNKIYVLREDVHFSHEKQYSKRLKRKIFD